MRDKENTTICLSCKAPILTEEQLSAHPMRLFNNRNNDSNTNSTNSTIPPSSPSTNPTDNNKSNIPNTSGWSGSILPNKNKPREAEKEREVDEDIIHKRSKVASFSQSTPIVHSFQPTSSANKRNSNYNDNNNSSSFNNPSNISNDDLNIDSIYVRTELALYRKMDELQRILLSIGVSSSAKDLEYIKQICGCISECANALAALQKI